MTAPGPELDRLLCEAVGIAPHAEWTARAGTYPLVSTSGHWMCVLMDALEARGWFCSLECGFGDYCGTCLRREAWGQPYYRAGDIYQVHHSTRAGAFALAAWAALWKPAAADAAAGVEE